MVECGGCGLVRLFPQPCHDELALYYPPDYWFAPDASAGARLTEAYRRFVLRDHVNFVVRALENSGERGPVLDVGCGGGLFLRILRERGWPGLGLDQAPRAAAIAWRHNSVPAFCAALEAAPLPPGSCAAVTMFHVLEHLPDGSACLEAARGLLRPNGRLIVQVPNAACWQFLLLGEGWNGVDVPRHLVNYRARDLEILLHRCGFEVLRHKHFSLRDNPAGLATSLAPWLDPMARRMRGLREWVLAKLAKDLLYFALVMACLPFTVLEAACRAGSTVIMEARKKS